MESTQGHVLPHCYSINNTVFFVYFVLLILTEFKIQLGKEFFFSCVKNFFVDNMLVFDFPDRNNVCEICGREHGANDITIIEQNPIQQTPVHFNRQFVIEIYQIRPEALIDFFSINLARLVIDYLPNNLLCKFYLKTSTECEKWKNFIATHGKNCVIEAKLTSENFQFWSR